MHREFCLQRFARPPIVIGHTLQFRTLYVFEVVFSLCRPIYMSSESKQSAML